MDTRFELARRIIANERDYMSTFSSKIRNTWNVGPYKALLYSSTLSGSIEQAFGCDTAIVISDGQIAKLCLIEAKWPRAFTRNNYRWDTVPTASPANPRPLSHFSDQLDRQRAIMPFALVLEMFINETIPGTPILDWDLCGSTCILSNDAYNFDISKRNRFSRWKNSDLNTLLSNFKNMDKTLFYFIEELAECRLGVPVPIINGEIKFGTAEKERELAIPVVEELFERQAQDIVSVLGLENLLVLNVPPNDELNI